MLLSPEIHPVTHAWYTHYVYDTYIFLQQVCTDIDECSNEEACGEYQDCENLIGSYTCSCQAGFEFNDINLCVDIGKSSWSII